MDHLLERAATSALVYCILYIECYFNDNTTSNVIMLMMVTAATATTAAAAAAAASAVAVAVIGAREPSWGHCNNLQWLFIWSPFIESYFFTTDY